MYNILDIFPEMILSEHLEVYKSSFTTKWECPTLAHGYGHLDFIQKGCHLVIKDNKEYPVRANQIIFVPMNIDYYQKVKETPYGYHSFLFSYVLNDVTKDIKDPIIISAKNTAFFIEKYRLAYHLYLTKPVAYKTKIRKIIYEVLDKICEEEISKQNSETGLYTIRKSVEYIHENYSDPTINSQKIARISGITSTYFRHIFKKIYMVTPNKYINNLRISKAKSLLENTDYTIEEISYRCGYRDYSYFSKAFSKSTGISPSEYRKKNNTTKKEL
ncbi:MAG: helix-turn-helix transcriptional regulator [Ruminococcaceae bacterium]|nr:helix-turn-helix transcriptional regulator [Oscillospiraceae bacterium]